MEEPVIEMEDDAGAKRRTRIEIQKTILLGIAGAGLIAAALIAPNVVGAAYKIHKMTKDNERQYRYRAKITLGRLRKKGWVELVWHSGKAFYRLTEAGERQLLKYRLKEKALEKRRWDGRWRMVVFDIKETKRTVRDRWRREIALFGFIRLQDSVWVSPYDSEELIALLKAEFHIGREVLYVVADSIENDGNLRKRFGLEDR